MSDGQQRSGSDTRVASNGFATDRENFRDRNDRDISREASSREPPSGPKAFRDASRPLLIAPSGPRGSNPPGEFRGRGAARGRGWRDNSRDRGRDADYRDREERGGAHRNDRGREWGRSDRDWPERDRIYRDNISFRDRRPSSPGNSRSPGRRGSRDVPLSLDTRKGSRDGPLSASSQSDQSAGPSAGLGRGYGRASSRGRGDWDSRGRGDWDLRGRGEWDSRGRGRGSYFDDQGRRGRSRSPEGPQRRVFASRSPSSQAPEVPAFGTPIDSTSQESFGTGINIPTAPRNHKPISKGAKFGSQHSHPVPTSVKWIRSEQAPSTQEASAIEKPISTLDTASKPVEYTASNFSGEQPIWLEVDEEKNRVPCMQDDIPIDVDSEEENSDSGDENSDSDSADEMGDYLKALQKPHDRPPQTTLDDIRGISNAVAGSNLDRSLASELINEILFETVRDVVQEDRRPPTPKASPTLEVASPTPVQITRPKFAIPEVAEETDMELDEELEAVRQKQLEVVPDEQLHSIRRCILTPPLDSLPDWGRRPWNESEELKDDMENASAFIKQHTMIITQEAQEEKDYMDELKRQYKEYYRQYLIFCDSDDPAAINYRKRLETNTNPKRAESTTPAVEGRLEGRRAASRFATEHDMERVLKESEREARETQEKNDKVANAKAASEKEATIHNMLSSKDRQRPIFLDTSHLVSFERSLAVLEFGPPEDDFTADECRVFEEKYLEFPKDFRTISSFLPGRDTKNCIQHYYLVKHKDDLKGKLKTRERGRKRGRNPGGSKPKSNALIASLGSRSGENEDVQDGDGNGERRRPRRAAAPTWPRDSAASESETPTPAPSRKTTATPKADNCSEAIPGKRKAKPNSSRDKSKQPKNSQPLAAAPTGIKGREEETSPLPVHASTWRPRGLSDPSQIPNPWDGTQLQPSSLVTRPIHDVLGSPEILSQVYNSRERMGPLPPNIGFNSQQEQRNNSSYWSVTEKTEFPALLRSYGTDWIGIAKRMGTKSHVMVKNHYTRNVEEGKSGFEEIAKDADEKRKRGESNGPPPTPTMPIKQRRSDVPLGTLQRPLNPALDPTGEINLTGQVMVHTSSPQGPQSILFSGHAQATVPPAQVVQTAHQVLIASEQIQHQQGQQIVQPGRPSRGPTLGYFSAERGRPILQAATPQHKQQSALDATRTQRTLIAPHEAQLEVQQALCKEQQTRDHLEQQMRDQQARDQQLREQQLREQQLREQQLREQQLREQQMREQQMREQQMREQKVREQQLREQQLREQQLREQQLREQELREQQMREQQLREQQLREQQLREQVREQQLREQQLREQQLREQQLREQQMREQQLREQQLREQQLREQQLREQQLREQQMREQQLREQQLREQQLREQQLREQQLREQQIREQQIREQQIRDQQLRDQQLREQQMREQQMREQQILEQQLRDKQLREQQLREQQAREQVREKQLREQQAQELREQQIREQQTAREQLREQQSREQQNRDQARQHIRPKQEIEMPSLSQYEKYSGPSQSSTVSQPREGSSIYNSDIRHSISNQQYGPRSVQSLKKLGNDVASGGPTSLPSVPQHASRNSMNGPIHQEPQATSRLQAPSLAPVRQQETVRKTSNIMSLLNDEPSEQRPILKREAPLPVTQPSVSPAPQGLYQQARPLSGTQPPPIRRETPLGDMHSTQNYVRSTSSSQGPVRVVEPPYPVSQSQSQQNRSLAGSPMEPTSATEIEYYTRQQPYGTHSQQQTPVDSPRLGPAFHNQQQQPHRSMAFGTSAQRTASPPSQYSSNHSVRHDSFDNRFPIPPHSRYNSSGSVTPAPYPPTTQLQHPLSSVRLTGSQSSTQAQLTAQITPQPPQPLQPQPQQHQQVSSHSYASISTHPSMQHHMQSGPARSFSPPRPQTYDSRGYPEQQGQQQPPPTLMRRQLLQTQQQTQHLLPHQQREQRE